MQSFQLIDRPVAPSASFPGLRSREDPTMVSFPGGPIPKGAKAKAPAAPAAAPQDMGPPAPKKSGKPRKVIS